MGEAEMTVAQEAVGNDPRAHAALRAAHDAAYRLPPGFGGFTAQVTYINDAGSAQGAVTVAGPRAVELDIEVDDEARGWLTREIASIAGHRWHLPYDAADGKHTLALSPDGDDLLGQYIVVTNDRLHSSYRVRDAEISQVNRTMGSMRFSIQIQERITTADGRTLPSHFAVCYWSTADDRLTRTDLYRDAYAVVGEVYLPAERRIITADDSGLRTQAIVFSEHCLLEDGVSEVAEQLEHSGSRAD
jgi:hypothetical protein